MAQSTFLTWTETRISLLGIAVQRAAFDRRRAALTSILPAGEQLTIDWKPIPRHVLTPVGHLSFGTKPADGSDVVSIVVKGRNEWDPVQPDYDVWFKVRRAGLLARLCPARHASLHPCLRSRWRRGEQWCSGRGE